ncbi:MAG TPA: hypothetical protein VGF92_10440 [Stellaceae bacterium]|jgi:hypothetical protein
MVFGAELALEPLVFFFAVFLLLFFFELFFAVLLVEGDLVVVVVVPDVDELEPCACAAYGTVDAPTNASRANAEINAFILRYS